MTKPVEEVIVSDCPNPKISPRADMLLPPTAATGGAAAAAAGIACGGGPPSYRNKYKRKI